MKAADYFAQLQTLLPRGDLWRRDQDASLTLLLKALAAEFARIDVRAQNLLREADPRTTTELLEDFERVAGLPDPCVPDVQSMEARRLRLVQKLTGRGGQSRGFFIELATGLGFPITITEFRRFTAVSSCIDGINQDPWCHVWRINAPAVRIDNMTVTSACNEPIRSWGNELLECVLTRLKPAHTHLLFGYGGQ
ncbi:putative phage tail protein [Mesorhizobium sp. KR1-2]|uniref:YmfQ family protein n=1 Tax=Mesorhizobium sp. KR1-2 TaxID=3156609 RepID=UPI0032B4C09E